MPRPKTKFCRLFLLFDLFFMGQYFTAKSQNSSLQAEKYSRQAKNNVDAEWTSVSGKLCGTFRSICLRKFLSITKFPLSVIGNNNCVFTNKQGIGMSFCFDFIKTHGGKMEDEGVEEKFTEFQNILPV